MQRVLCAGLMLCGAVTTTAIDAQNAPSGPDTTARWGVEAGLGAGAPTASLLRFFDPRRALVFGLSGSWSRDGSSDGGGSVRTSDFDVRAGLRLLGRPQRVRPASEIGIVGGRQGFTVSEAPSVSSSLWRYGGYVRGGVQLHATPRIAALLAVEAQWVRLRPRFPDDGVVVLEGESVGRRFDNRTNRIQLGVPVVGLTLLF
jgi:hypothetical protein